MTKNPILNALSASAYISVIAFLAIYAPHVDNVKSILIPMLMLSLFTLSAAVMAFLFFYQPFQLYFSGEKKKALHLFLQTIGAFALLTLGILAFLLYRFYH